MRFVLASASSGRLATLRAGGFDPAIIVSGVDESTVDASDPRELCAQLARLKAAAVAETLAGPTLVLGCDSVLSFDGAIHGKPADADQATQLWRRLRGRSGTLHTGHCLLSVADGRRAEEVGSTTVHFADITDDEIASYVATGEPLRVAGAFTIDSLGGWFVERIEGDPSNVVGVSLPVLRRLLRLLGVAVSDLWPPPQPVASSS